MNLSEAIKNRYGEKEPEFAAVVRTTYTVKEVAEFIGISVDHVYKLCREKKMPHIKIGARILFKKETILKWLSELEFQPQ